MGPTLFITKYMKSNIMPSMTNSAIIVKGNRIVLICRTHSMYVPLLWIETINDGFLDTVSSYKFSSVAIDCFGISGNHAFFALFNDNNNFFSICHLILNRVISINCILCLHEVMNVIRLLANSKVWINLHPLVCGNVRYTILFEPIDIFILLKWIWRLIIGS